MTTPRTSVAAVVLGARDARALAEFYSVLLGWPIAIDQDGEWVMLRNPDGGTGLSFQREEHHVPPTWPAGPDDQQMMLHLDIAVDDLDAGVRAATAAGATLAEQQPQSDVRVLLDPAGHPFCLFQSTFADE